MNRIIILFYFFALYSTNVFANDTDKIFWAKDFGIISKTCTYRSSRKVKLKIWAELVIDASAICIIQINVEKASSPTVDIWLLGVKIQIQTIMDSRRVRLEETILEPQISTKIIGRLYKVRMSVYGSSYSVNLYVPLIALCRITT